jgi:hypothetical protein
MKKRIIAIAAVLGLGAGLAVLSAPLAASATVSAPAEYCIAITETQPNPAYVPEVLEISHEIVVVDSPAIPGTPEIPEISHTQYQYKQLITGKIKWLDTFDWNPGLGWYYTGQTQVVIDQAYVPAVPEIPAVTHTEIVIDTPYQPAIGEPTIEVPTGDFTCTNLPVTWQSPTYDPNASGWSTVGKPQSFIGIGYLPAEACETTRQHDNYSGLWSAISALWADSYLTDNNGTPEDSSLVQSWSFTHGGYCMPETPEPTVEYGEWSVGEVNCEVPDGIEEREVYTTTYTVVGDAETGYTITSDTVTTTEPREIHYDGDCTVVEEPPVEEPPVVTTSDDELAYTGTESEAIIGWTLVGAIALVGGTIIVVLGLRRRKV